jgi:hypothetical protein
MLIFELTNRPFLPLPIKNPQSSIGNLFLSSPLLMPIPTTSRPNLRSARIVDGRSWIADGRSWIEDGRSRIADGRSRIVDGRSRIVDGRSRIVDGRSRIVDAPGGAPQGVWASRPHLPPPMAHADEPKTQGSAMSMTRHLFLFPIKNQQSSIINRQSLPHPPLPLRRGRHRFNRVGTSRGMRFPLLHPLDHQQIRRRPQTQTPTAA